MVQVRFWTKETQTLYSDNRCNWTSSDDGVRCTPSKTMYRFLRSSQTRLEYPHNP